MLWSLRMPAPALANNSDSSCAPSQPCVRDPDLNPPLSDLSIETFEVKARDIELEEKDEGFIGPRLPRMLTDKEVKAIFDRLL